MNDIPTSLNMSLWYLYTKNQFSDINNKQATGNIDFSFIKLTLSSPVLTTHLEDNIKLAHLKGNVTTEGRKVSTERF